jgi:hypothetical protein
MIERAFPDLPGIRTGGYSFPGTLRVGGPALGGPRGVRMQVGFYSPKDVRQRPAGLYTVQFNVDVDGVQDPLFRYLNPVATVIWSVEGNSIRRRLSVVNGTSLTGVCDAVEVTVVDETDFFPPPGPIDYQITISVTPFPRPRSGSPPILRGTATPVAVAGGGPAVLVPVPFDAGANSVMVLASSTGGAIPVAGQEDTNTVNLASWTPDTNFVPLLPQAGNISLSNLGPPASSASFSVLFGVDG